MLHRWHCVGNYRKFKFASYQPLLLVRLKCYNSFIQSASAGDTGDGKTSRTHGIISIVCSFVAWVVAIVGLAIIIGAVVGGIQAAVSSNR